MPQLSRFTHFSWGQIESEGFAPCKRIDILQLCGCECRSYNWGSQSRSPGKMGLLVKFWSPSKVHRWTLPSPTVCMLWLKTKRHVLTNLNQWLHQPFFAVSDQTSTSVYWAIKSITGCQEGSQMTSIQCLPLSKERWKFVLILKKRKCLQNSKRGWGVDLEFKPHPPNELFHTFKTIKMDELLPP